MRAIGIVLAGGNNHRMRELSNKRAVAAMPVAGSYRGIDFALSNMSNSHIQRVAVLTQYNARSLNEHLNSSKWWDFGRKQGGLYIFTPTITADNSKVLEYHIEKKADITVVCKDMPADTDVSRFGVLKTDEEGRITEFEEKPVETQESTISCGIYVIRRRQLIELIEKCAQEDRYDFVRDILIRYKNLKRIFAYRTTDYWSNIASVESYYETNMDFLKADVRKYFFKTYPDVYTQ